jgi:hypothetical protein
VQRTVVHFTLTVHFDAIWTGNERPSSTALAFFMDALALYFNVEVLATGDRVMIFRESRKPTDHVLDKEYWPLVAITFAFLLNCVYAVWALISKRSLIFTVSQCCGIAIVMAFEIGLSIVAKELFG